MKLKLMAAALLIPWTAQAADLGGNCCADLEERVAELEATVARKGNRKMSLEVSGHINQAIFTSDIDGANLDKVRIIDNDNSESRFRFKGEARQGSWAAGFLMEFGLGGYDLDVRHQAVYLKLKDFGTLWLGKTSESTDGVTEISVVDLYRGSTLLNLSPLMSVVTGETGLGYVEMFDGGRTNTVTFRSASLPGGFQFSGSWNEGEDYSVALRWAQEFQGVRLAAGIGYRDEQVCSGPSPCTKIGDRTFWGGSGSAMHVATGIYLEGAYGNSDGIQELTFAGIPFPVADTKLEAYAGRLGFAKKISAYGKTGVYGEFGQLKIKDADIDPRYYGLGFSQEVTGAAATLYLNWRQYDLDVTGMDDVNTFYGGVLIRF